MRRAAGGVVCFTLSFAFAASSLASLPTGSAAAGASSAASVPANAHASHPLSAIVLPAVGPGYAVVAEGPLDPATFAADAPDPAAATGALAALGSRINTYQRTWLDPSRTNAVQDLLVRFPTSAAAQVFLQSAEHALETGEIVSSGPLAEVPGARRTTYFGTTTQPGVGQAITMRAGVYVGLLSFFSGATGNPQPISPADGIRVARAQQAAMAAAPGGRDGAARTVTPVSLAWAALAVAVVAAAVATPMVLRRRRAREQAGSRTAAIPFGGAGGGVRGGDVFSK